MMIKKHFERIALLLLLCLLPSGSLLPASKQNPKARDAAIDALLVPNDKDLRKHDKDDGRLAPEDMSRAKNLVKAAGVTAQATSGSDYRIAALLSGYQWSPGSTITYSFYSYARYGGVYYGPENGVNEVSAAVKVNVRQIMAWYGSLINLTLSEVDESTGQVGAIRFMVSRGPSYAYSYYPTSSSPGSVAGDIHLNPNYDRLGDTNGFQHPAGQHGYLSLIHEIGHALGLKHPFEGYPALPASEDNESQTVMTYTFTGYSSGTPMGYDLMALQYLYGPKSNKTSNDTYAMTNRGSDQYSTAGTLYLNTPYLTRQTIWDSAGTNSVDASGLPFNSTGYRLDINELGWLVANGAVSNPTSAMDFSYGSVLAMGVSVRDLVNSSSSDSIRLNPLPNVVRGYSSTRANGNDVIYGASAEDTLDLSSYAGPVSTSSNGYDLVLTLGSNGSITIKDYYNGCPMVVTAVPIAQSISISDATVTEGNSGIVAAVFTVTLSGPSQETVTVNWATSDGTAKAGNDYVANNGTVTFAPGETSQAIAVAVLGDTVVEPSESFSVTLNSPLGGSTPPSISDGLGVGSIVDDDTVPLVITDMTPHGGTYSKSSTVQITAVVTQGQAVTGATVVFSMLTPRTSKLTKATVTTVNGVATWKYFVPKNAASGSYKVTANVTYASQSVSGGDKQASFTVY